MACTIVGERGRCGDFTANLVAVSRYLIRIHIGHRAPQRAVMRDHGSALVFLRPLVRAHVADSAFLQFGDSLAQWCDGALDFLNHSALAHVRLGQNYRVCEAVMECPHTKDGEAKSIPARYSFA